MDSSPLIIKGHSPGINFLSAFSIFRIIWDQNRIVGLKGCLETNNQHGIWTFRPLSYFEEHRGTGAAFRHTLQAQVKSVIWSFLLKWFSQNFVVKSKCKVFFHKFGWFYGWKWWWVSNKLCTLSTFLLLYIYWMIQHYI